MKTCFWVGIIGCLSLMIYNNKVTQQVTLSGTLNTGDKIVFNEYDVEIDIDDCYLIMKKSTTTSYKDQEKRKTHTIDLEDFTYVGDECSINKMKIGKATLEYNPLRGWVWRLFNLEGHQSNGLYGIINSSKIKTKQVPE